MTHHLSGHDVVPPLRTDLEPLPEPSGTGAEIITLAPVEGAGAMRMHGFELSIARMLDGRRTAHDVVANAKRLGLPLSVDALEDFVGQLRTHGLLGTEPVSDARLTWPPAARDLYRDGLKAAREGNFDRARAYLDAMRELQPSADEPKQLREWLDSHPDPRTAGSTFGETFANTLDSWSQERPPHWAAEVRDATRHSWWPVLGPITAVGFLIAYMLLPHPYWVNTTAQLSPARSVPVAMPANGAVNQLMVREGDHVEEGEPLFAYSVAGLQLRVRQLNEQLDKERAPAREQVAKTREGAALMQALVKSQDELKSAEEAQRALLADPAATSDSGRMLAAERRVANALGTLEAARRQIDRRIPPDAPGAKAASKLAAEAKALSDRIAAQTVKAPRSGSVAQLGAELGQTVEKGEPVMQLSQLDRLKMVAPLPGRAASGVGIGTPITVRIGEERLHTQVSEVSKDGISAEVPNLGGELKPGALQVQLQVPPRPRQIPMRPE